MRNCFQTLFLCLTILLSYVSLTESGYCPVEFEDVCECGYVRYGPENKLTYVTKCSNTGFDNALMLRKLPPETEVLIFVGNEVKDLPVNIFDQDIVYDKLHTIDMSNNHIQTIKGKTFHNVANVTKLILNDNDLYIVFKDLRPRMFSNFINLEELHLRNAFTEKVKARDYLTNLAQIFKNSSLNHLKILNMESNEISNIQPDEFCSLPALQELYLGNNHLKDIPLNFSCIKHLRILDTGNNLIPHLSDASLQNLEHVKNNSHLMVNLTANPFRCDCSMVKTYKWIMTTNITLVNRENFQCLDGFHLNIGKTVASVKLNELQCIPMLKEFNYHYSPSLMTLTVGMILVLIGVITIIYKNRTAVGTSWRRIIYPIRSKFHYVSLDNRATMDV